MISQFVWNHKRPRTAKAILRRKKKTPQGITLPGLWQYCKATVVKTEWCWHKNRHKDQWKRIECPGKLLTYLQPINLQQRRQERRQEYKIGKSLLSRWCLETWTAVCKSANSENVFTSYTKFLHKKINSKWLKSLIIRYDTIKLLEEIIGKTFFGINCTNVFVGQSLKAIEIRTKRNKWEIIKVRYLHSKGNYKQNEKISYGMGENICKQCNWQGLNFQNIQTAHTIK